LSTVRVLLRPAGPLTQVEDFGFGPVIRHREALNWLLEQPGMDAGPGVHLGSAMGPIITFAAAAVDPRVKVCVPWLCGRDADVSEQSFPSQLEPQSRVIR